LRLLPRARVFPHPRGTRSRTICIITDLPAPTREIIAASLKGQDFLPADPVQLHDALDYGGLAVFNDAWSRLHLGELFADVGSPRQRGLLQAVIGGRQRFPCAKLSLSQKAQGTWLAQACGLDASESFDGQCPSLRDLEMRRHVCAFKAATCRRSPKTSGSLNSA